MMEKIRVKVLDKYNCDRKSVTHLLTQTVFLFVLYLISATQVKSQDSLIHNKDRNTFVNFSEPLDFMKKQLEENSESPAYTITLNNSGYMLLIKFLGESRDIRVEKRQILDNFFKAIGVYESNKEIFKKEVLVQTDAGYFWFPIQEELLKIWFEELGVGDSALIYIRYYGSFSGATDESLVFTINGFNSDYYNGLWEEMISNFNEGKDTIGLRCLNKLISIDPNDGRNYAAYGYYYTMLGNRTERSSNAFKNADSLFSIAEKLSPEYAYQYYQRAILKLYVKDYVQSWRLIEKARSLEEPEIEPKFIEDLESKLPYKKFLKKDK